MTQEERFFDLIQQEAQRQSAKFFVSCGEGRELITDELDGEDFSGWLVPLKQADAFLAEMRVDEARAAETWAHCFTFAEWSEEAGTIKIKFQEGTK